MPFVSDEQRKAAFANMHRGGGGGGGNAPRHGSTKGPKTPKPKKPKKPKVNNYGQWSTGVGYAGNYTAGLPNYSNWYQSLPNTTGATPPLTQSSSSMPSGYGTIPQGSFNLIWEDYQGYQPRELTTAEKILLGIPVAATVAWAMPGIMASTGGAQAGMELAGMVDVWGTTMTATSTGSEFIAIYGTQGAALGYSGLSITGIPMTINDAPSYYRDGNVVRNTYPDLVGWIGGQIRTQPNIDYTVSASGIDWTIRP